MTSIAPASAATTSSKRTKPDELLSSVIKETAVPAAVERLKSNTPFAIPNREAWILLVLNAASIGGLNRKQTKDADKGSIVGLIDADIIETVATEQMLEENYFGIIPTESTLGRMEEYGLLKNAEYTWALVTQTPQGELAIDPIDDTDRPKAERASHVIAAKISMGLMPLEDAFTAPVWARLTGQEASGQDADVRALASESPTQAMPRVDDKDSDDVLDALSSTPQVDPASGPPPAPTVAPSLGALPDGAEEYVGEDEDDPTAGLIEVDPEPFIPSAEDLADDDFDEGEEYDDPDLPYDMGGEGSGLVANPAQEVGEGFTDSTDARSSLARRFLSNDLDLQIRLDEFNTTFAVGAPVVQITVPEGATEWLGDQVAQLSRQANADLFQLRRAHEDELRTLYVDLMSRHAEAVIAEHVTDGDESKKFSALMKSIKADHDARSSDQTQVVERRKKELFESFENDVTRVGKEAALTAEARYRERHRSVLEKQHADVLADVEREIEEHFAFDQQQLNQVRRESAELKMAIGQSRVFEVLSEKQNEYFDREEQRLAEWKSEIQAVISEFRSADITQAEALAERNRTVDEVAALRREQEALLEAARGAHADRERKLQDQVDRVRVEAVQQIQAREVEWQHQLEIEKQTAAAHAQRTTELLAQLNTTEQSVGARYEARINELEADKKAYEHQMARASEIQRRSNTILTVMIVTLAIIVGMVGFIIGVAF